MFRKRNQIREEVFEEQYEEQYKKRRGLSFILITIIPIYVYGMILATMQVGFNLEGLKYFMILVPVFTMTHLLTYFFAYAKIFEKIRIIRIIGLIFFWTFVVIFTLFDLTYLRVLKDALFDVFS